ncbi:unnamed protein product [Plutella xylostella]|uniref:Methionine synthase reductase n=1 Tax=Plutella xylostella TaxID=51655 RepID=A0A8S4G3M7_PLUXY|nr:unnamed protein product [Plutella xylostella]
MWDLLSISSQFAKLDLPPYKENGLTIKYLHSTATKPATVYGGKEPILPFAESELVQAEIATWRRLSAECGDCKAVYEVTLDTKDSNLKFRPGDTIGVLPQNIATEVDFLLEHLELTSKADVQYELTVDKAVKGAKIPPHIPVQSSLRHVLTHCVDVRGVVKKLFLLALSKHTENENEKKVLQYICSKDGSAAYNSHILHKNTCLIDLLQTFKTCRPPIEVILANVGRLLPRPYSIVNRQTDSKMLKICFSVIQLENNRKGLTTGGLESMILKKTSIEEGLKNLSLNEGGFGKVSIYLRKNMNGFALPEDPEKPLLLIGPGTGVAPFIGFLEERQAQKEEKSTLKLGDVWLFFGCRNPKLDFLYEHELNEFVEKGCLTRLSTAFSRIENDGVKYVQHAITRDGKDIAKFIKNAHIFVCGDLKSMASQVRDSIRQCLVLHDGNTEEEAERFMTQMEKDKRYIVDIWS